MSGQLSNDLQPPKTLRANKLYRAWLLDRAEKSPAVQRYLMQRCKDDLSFFINTFVFQFNPNSIGDASVEIGPFITWDFQDEACETILSCLYERRDLVIEKSREMGASWLCLLVMLWFFLFHPWKKFLCISRNEDAVDKAGDSDSLFWKLDFVLERLPTWMVVGRVKRQGLAFNNPLLKSAITGQASTAKAGVGGRAFGMFIDEYSLFDNGKDYEVLKHTANTTSCRIFNGTQRGVDKAFYELSQRLDYRKLQMHWTKHPDKCPGLYRYVEGKVEVLDKQYKFGDFNFVMSEAPAGGPYPGLRSPYYDDQCVRQGSARAVAMNLDMDASGADEQFFDAIQIRRLQNTYTKEGPVWEGEIDYDPDTGHPMGLTASKGGRLRLWLNPTHDGKVRKARYAIGGDIAWGTGATPSCLEILDAVLGEQVGEYVNPHIQPINLAPLAVALCWLFQGEDGEGAMFGWELQGPGVVFGKRVLELGYRNILRRSDDKKIPGLTNKGDRERPGWSPLGESKMTLLEEMRSALYAQVLVVRSAECLAECLKFRYGDNNKIEHAEEESPDDPSGARVNHGDRVIGMGIAWKLAKRLGAGTLRLKPEKPKIHPSSLHFRRMLEEDRKKEQEAWA